MRNKLSLRREAQPHRGDAPLTPNGKPETFLASWVGDTIIANPGRACTNAAKPPLRPRFCTFSTSKPATFENVTVLHDTKPTFTFSNPRLLLQAALEISTVRWVWRTPPSRWRFARPNSLHWIARSCWLPKRECHIAPGWLLIYETNETEVRLARTGTHSDLFGR